MDEPLAIATCQHTLSHAERPEEPRAFLWKPFPYPGPFRIEAIGPRGLHDPSSPRDLGIS
jgi:hypothetical protein